MNTSRSWWYGDIDFIIEVTPLRSCLVQVVINLGHTSIAKVVPGDRFLDHVKETLSTPAFRQLRYSNSFLAWLNHK